ncbi:MAG: nitroreductase family protein [Candidatus Bathyarchaeota archaeon]|nr:nitroreductase family protein [Candidatus Bathyarchaeota archaeon]
MDFYSTIDNRRSIRRFTKETVPQEVLNRLLDAGRRAPSAGNAQPWAFIVVTLQAIKELIMKAAYGQRAIGQSSVLIVVCADEKRAEEAYGDRGKSLYCLQDTAAAVENILLAATASGLGACWMGAFNEAELRTIIKAPPHMRPVAVIPVGIPNESPPQRSRRELIEIVYKETF